MIHEGRSRRDLIQKATGADTIIMNITTPLRRQVRWWYVILSKEKYRPSPIWFRDEHQDAVLIQSDASGDAGFGFGFCAAGFHVTGRWSPTIHEFIKNDVFVKETFPSTIVILLLHRLLPNYIFCNTCDNSGVVFRLNCDSCFRSNKCISADMRIPRLAEALPHHLRHNAARNPNPPHPPPLSQTTLTDIISIAPTTHSNLTREPTHTLISYFILTSIVCIVRIQYYTLTTTPTHRPPTHQNLHTSHLTSLNTIHLSHLHPSSFQT